MRIHRHRQRKPKLNIPRYKVNEDIEAETLRVLDAEGEMLGVISKEEALSLAREKELDLVEVSPKADPPVAKIIDYGHFKYQKEKDAKKQKAQSKEVEIKGIRLSLRIAVGDRGVRLNAANKFLEHGNKVRIELILRGREKAHFDLARKIVEDFIEEIRETYPIRVEQPVKKQGGRVTTIIARE